MAENGPSETSTQRRFWAKVDKRGPASDHRPDLGSCWLWIGATNYEGYGVLRPTDGKALRAHRYAYELLVGEVPSGLELDHLCRVRHCVNPGHLEAVTHRENTLRGEGPTAQLARRTHCGRGHELTPENTAPFPHAPNGRKCLACGRITTAADKARRRAEKARQEGRDEKGVAIAMLTVTELAERIDAHLRRFEADPEINEQTGYGRPYYSAGSARAGGRVQVRYISYQGHHNLKRADAERYLAWLDAGNVGRHSEALRPSSPEGETA